MRNPRPIAELLPTLERVAQIANDNPAAPTPSRAVRSIDELYASLVRVAALSTGQEGRRHA
ncbi:MAG: hypothetical protein Q7J32_17510 [Sphingomonadaceae bacterium]|nr:hypothetical protein [Sphingomonadaceae bacterium]